MQKPPALPQHGRIRVLTPAGPVTPELLEQGIAELESWGFDVELDEFVYARSDSRGYLAGEDAQRVGAVQAALDATDIDAVVFSRGGYGSMRLLERLDVQGLREHPKLIVGFSDITAIQLWLATEGITSLHGPVIKSFRLHDDDPFASLDALRDAMTGRRADGFRIEGMDTVVPGRARGRIFGGNLSLLASMVGTPYCPDLNGSLLFLEDIGEEDYRLDRMLTALRLSAKAHSPAAILLGDFTECGGAYFDDQTIQAFVGDLATEFGCPVVSGLPVGHASRNIALPVGARATLDATEGVLYVEEDAVETAGNA
ncbi:MAG: S66 peptidase family protein [Myxococcota bacterium]